MHFHLMCLYMTEMLMQMSSSIFIRTYLEVSTLCKTFAAIWKCTHEGFDGPMYLFMSL